MAFYTREQFDALRKQGYSAEQIVSMSKSGTTPIAPAEKKQGLGKSVSDFIGTTALGKGLAGTAANVLGFDKPIDEALAASSSIQGEVAAKIREKRARGEDTSRLEAALAGQQAAAADALKTKQEITTGGVSARQVIGGALQTAGTIASFGTLPGVGAAAAGIGKVAPMLSGKIAQAGIRGALAAAPASAAIGGGRSLVQGESDARAAAEAIAQGFTGGVVGGAIGAGTAAISALVKKGASAVYNNVLGVSKQMKLAGKSPSEFLKDKKSFGTLGSYARASIEGMKQAGTKIDEALAASTKKINYASVKDAAFETLKKNYGNAYDETTLRALVDEVPASVFGGADEVGVASANELRKTLDKILGSNFFVSQATKPLSKEAMSAVAGALRKTIQSETGTQALFKEYSNWINVKKLVDGAMANADSFWKPGLFDLIGAGAGASRGETYVDRLKNAVGGVAAVRASRSALVQTLAASFASKLASLPAEGLTRAAVITALGSAMDEMDE